MRVVSMSCIAATMFVACGDRNERDQATPEDQASQGGVTDVDHETCGAAHGSLWVESEDQEGWAEHQGEGLVVPFMDGCGLVCGPNAPVANTFPINGLIATKSGAAACDPDGVRLVKYSLHGGSCGVGATLDMQGNNLVGMRDGSVACAGSG